MGVHTTERVAQLILGLVSVSQFRPRTASHAVSRGVIKKRVDTRGTPSALDSVSSTSSVMDLRCRVPLNKRRLMGKFSEWGVMWEREMNSGETKQSEALESNRTQMAMDPIYSWRMKESLFRTAARVAVYGIRQFSSSNEYIEELPASFPGVQ